MADISFILCFTSAAALSDLRSGKIPNRLILCGLLCGAFRITLAQIPILPVFPASPSIPDALLGFFLPYLALFIPFMLSMIGGGDLKLLSVIGLLFGFLPCAKIMLYSLAAGGVLAAFTVLARRNLTSRLRYFFCYLQSSLTAKKPGPYRTCNGEHDGAQSGDFCFSPAIFAGLIIHLIRTYA